MGNLHSDEHEKKNNLELYLNDVYEKECEFRIKQKEIKFIKTGIETLVQDLVDLIVKHIAFEKLISDQIDEYDTGNVQNNGKHLVEVCFPVHSDCPVERYVAENVSLVNIAQSTIIKVGSFYDDTKNNFPDEFDFIFPVQYCRNDHSFNELANDIKQTVEEVIKKYGQSLHYPSMNVRHQATQQLYFKEYKGEHGPAYKIQFIYSNGSGEQRPINVDFVPGYKIIDSDINQWFQLEVRQYVKPKTFCEEILSAKHSLYVNGRLAFTEIEQHFMKNILSKKHVKVYRILKYLLNGNGDGEKLEEYIRHRSEYMYTSYRIKILMIYHHELCTNKGVEDLGPCVLQLLKEMSEYECNDMFPSFSRLSPLDCLREEQFILFDYLPFTIYTLESLQRSEMDYNYERVKIKSVSGKFINLCPQLGIRSHHGTQPRATSRYCVIL